jgi:hypothetical protein
MAHISASQEGARWYTFLKMEFDAVDLAVKVLLLVTIITIIYLGTSYFIHLFKLLISL